MSHEPLPFIVRPITHEQPRTYQYREIRVINGVSYYFYHMHDPQLFKDPDAAFGSYIDTLSGLDFTPPSRRRWEIDRKKIVQSWACKCEICTNPPRTETFVTVKDYKVVEGLRLVKCAGFMSNMTNASKRVDLHDIASTFASVRNIPFHIPYPKEE